METIREFFHLEKYSEEAVETVVSLKTAYETSNMTIPEIAELTKIPVEDVREILDATFQVWGH